MEKGDGKHPPWRYGDLAEDESNEDSQVDEHRNVQCPMATAILHLHLGKRVCVASVGDTATQLMSCALHANSGTCGEIKPSRGTIRDAARSVTPKPARRSQDCAAPAVMSGRPPSVTSPSPDPPRSSPCGRPSDGLRSITQTAEQYFSPVLLPPVLHYVFPRLSDRPV